MPEQAGTFAIETEVGYVENGQYHFYQNLRTEVVIGEDAATLTGKILAALNALSVSKKDRTKVKDVIHFIQAVQEGRTTKAHMEENIQDILSAIDRLFSIDSVDVKEIRLMMDRLLTTWEGKWYFSK
jgi:hypothetical protein